jgi:dihydroneopterin aldolase
MSDMVFVTGLALHAYHGVMQHEAEVGQTFTLDLVVDIDLEEASRTDRLTHTVGYDKIVEAASRAFCGTRYRLVEAAAGAVADAILDQFAPVLAVRVTVHKPHAPIAATFADVGVILQRARKIVSNETAPKAAPDARGDA